MPAPPGGRRALALVSLASLGWALSFGVGATLSSLWLSRAGCSAGCIGLNTTFYYLGVALASPLVPALMRHSGRRCVVAGMILDAVTTAAFPFCEGSVWHLLRFAGGVGTALSLIPMETFVNRNAPPQRRARDFGVYAVCVASGIGLGPVVGLPLYPYAPRLAFGLGGAFTLLATVFAWLAVPQRSETETESGEAGLAWRAGLLGFGTAWVQGFLEGGMVTFLSLYLLSLGYAETVVSALLAGLFAGVVAAQLPVAWLADRVGRLRILLGCHAVLVVGLLVVPWSRWVPLTGRGCSCWGRRAGRCTFGAGAAGASACRGRAWRGPTPGTLASNCAGSLTGPLVIGLAIDAFGLSVQFAVGAAAVVAVAGLGVLSRQRREAPRRDEARRAA